jgi:hypothetical protein
VGPVVDSALEETGTQEGTSSMAEPIVALIEQVQKLAVPLQGILPEVRSFERTLERLRDLHDAPLRADLWLSAERSATVARLIETAGWQVRHRELRDGWVAELDLPASPVWVCAGDEVARVEERAEHEKPLKIVRLHEVDDSTARMPASSGPPVPDPPVAGSFDDGMTTVLPRVRATGQTGTLPAASAPDSPAAPSAPAPPVAAPPPAGSDASAAASPGSPSGSSPGSDTPADGIASLPATLAAAAEGAAAWRRKQAARAVRAALDWLDRSVDRQLTNTRLRRDLLQARLNPKGAGGRTPLPPAPGGASDPTNRAKALLSRMFGELEKGIGNADAGMLGVPAGRLIRELEELAESLVALQQTPRANAIATRVPHDFEDRVNRLFRERLFDYFSTHLKAINDLFHLAAHDLEKLVEKEADVREVLDPRLVKDDLITTLLDRTATFRSSHAGELPRRGFSEYFSQVRKYAMLLMMTASMLGATAVMRAYKEITVPLTVMLIGIGAFNVYSAAQEERYDAEQKDLEAARNAMKTEMRRILSEVQRQWSAVVSSTLGNQQQLLLDQVAEAITRENTLLAQQKEEERGHLQVQVVGLGDIEKRLLETKDRIHKAQEGLARFLGEAPPPAPPAPAARPGMPVRPAMPSMPRPGAPGGSPVVPPRPAPAAPAAPEASPAKDAMAAAREKLAAMREKMKEGAKPKGPAK